ncbi:MAG TPA: helicase, partial [Ktedonobacter sp.]|nr:helicase [Ktedonobacter sp.]
RRSNTSSQFEDAAYDGFHRLLDWKPVQHGYISGGLLIVPLADKQLQESYLMELARTLVDARDSDLWHTLVRIANDGEYYENLRIAIQDAIELIEKLVNAPQDKIQQLVQDSQQGDLYYAIPLLSFMYRDVMKDYFMYTSGDVEQYSFRALLTNYARSLYPISSALPIGDGYTEFPFIVFRSFMLKEARERMFDDSYLLISHEMNVLNMLLSYKRKI